MQARVRPMRPPAQCKPLRRVACTAAQGCRAVVRAQGLSAGGHQAAGAAELGHAVGATAATVSKRAPTWRAHQRH